MKNFIKIFGNVFNMQLMQREDYGGRDHHSMCPYGKWINYRANTCQSKCHMQVTPQTCSARLA